MSETRFPAPVTALRSQIESILLVVDTPVDVDTLSRVLGAEGELVAGILEEIRTEFETRGSGFDLRRSAEGWRLYTRPENAGVVEKLVLDGSQSRLSRAALETLAVVAYRQPVTRAQVSAVRGVNVDGVMRTLQLRGLIREVGNDETTGAHRYVTTELLLELLGIDSLDRLPDLAPLLPDVDSIDEDY
ncbi:SMC-Scp complex subunit ScpB [Corynebacterium sp. CCM 8835]|uniref:SMC-Scp complex subunit ScpB n=1 Tax=Corynebacterium antarcticum TaxID=2800405 RepID=A0A9Q4GKQ0_9CORY|nr:SMC-Scp complex subunit ScpB [Corynebacterium antarcticum]MCK7641323.1 SMC-Scp complex subunit ScpB [Corynebacterium antarcticum]MCK7660575.1 SMC-Scp complex subunit ScpB [Corynebacterium antarcticum]MCL0244554.1 SMC-Scp complex subunit ScpB [Corynebacterium antarcticum]MCX7490924.1 SMC-Scp complex subunit ScpB [Corynebacterium antarcticum]MCX7536948.1 SMC-Scp complex subunit ScpB [Corynebacterium antarcticum]